MIRRGIFTASPPAGDYILSTTGLTWNVDRTSATGGVLRVLAGEPNRKRALAALVGMADADDAGAWETVDAGSYRMIERRPSQR